MPLFLQHKEEAFQWAVWKMEESVEELLSIFPQKDFYEREIVSFVSSHRQQEWLSARVLLYTLLGEEKEIAYELSGKPYLSDHSYFISISHTKGYVAIILSQKSAVGIDIEYYGQRVHKVASRFIRSDEMPGSYQGDDTWGLLLHWSAKEAIYKCLEEVDADLCNLRIESFLPTKQGTFQAQEYWSTQQRELSVSYYIHPDFVLTWLLNE